MIAWFPHGCDGVVSRRISKSHFGRRGSVLLLLLTTGELGGGLVMTGRGKVGGRFDFIMEVRRKKLYLSVAVVLSQIVQEV